MLMAAMVISVLGGCGEQQTDGSGQGTVPESKTAEQGSGASTAGGEGSQPGSQTGGSTANSDRTGSAAEPTAVPEVRKTVALVAKETFYDGNGEITSVVEYEYDGRGNRTKYTGNFPKINSTAEMTYEYDEQGCRIKCIDVERTQYDSRENWTEYEYDASGRLAKETTFYEKGRIASQVSYKYDGRGNQTKVTEYDPNYGETVSDYVNEYDAAGNLVKVVCNYNGKMDYREEYAYDAAGNRIKYISYYPTGEILLWNEYEFDAAGNQIRYTVYKPDGSISYRVEYTYDAAGGQTGETAYKGDGSLYYNVAYKFDAAGNLTATTRSNAEGAVSIVTEYIVITLK